MTHRIFTAVDRELHLALEPSQSSQQASQIVLVRNIPNRPWTILVDAIDNLLVRGSIHLFIALIMQCGVTVVSPDGLITGRCSSGSMEAASHSCQITGTTACSARTFSHLDDLLSFPWVPYHKRKSAV
jgi:hypothetical protein